MLIEEKLAPLKSRSFSAKINPGLIRSVMELEKDQR